MRNAVGHRHTGKGNWLYQNHWRTNKELKQGNALATPTLNFQPIRLLDPDYCYKFTYLMANSADPDQLAASEANWSGSTLQRQGISGFSSTRVKTTGGLNQFYSRETSPLSPDIKTIQQRENRKQSGQPLKKMTTMLASQQESRKRSGQPYSGEPEPSCSKHR